MGTSSTVDWRYATLEDGGAKADAADVSKAAIRSFMMVDNGRDIVGYDATYHNEVCEVESFLLIDGRCGDVEMLTSRLTN